MGHSLMQLSQAFHRHLHTLRFSARRTIRVSRSISQQTLLYHEEAPHQQASPLIRRIEWPESATKGVEAEGKGEEEAARSADSKKRADLSGMNRRDRIDNTQRKRQKQGEDGKPPPVYVTEFSKEEIDNEERKPKRKVAVLFGYAGTGYKGLQLSDQEKTIEGEVFQAFVAAGAISKANANDPKKSALTRCARTDKGVHAAGNVLSVKLIIEDENLVREINARLSPQIRIWSIQRTNGSFSAYQMCDSRIYEYLIPTHCFVPPHPKSFLGKKMIELAIEENDLEGYESRQADVASFWSEAEEKYIAPVLESLGPDLRAQALQIIFEGGTRTLKDQSTIEGIRDSPPIRLDSPSAQDLDNGPADPKLSAQISHNDEKDNVQPAAESTHSSDPKFRVLSDLEKAVRALKSAYQSAKLAYRLTPARLALVRSSLSRYVGVHNFHNYTINKPAKDPSASRLMKSIVAGPDGSNDDPAPTLPVHGSTEWLSLKVHGQSFMMHQIRKMVSLAALVVRCGTHEGRIQDTFALDNYTIPTAPGLGLLLERPVFESYNENKRRGGAQPASSKDKNNNTNDNGDAAQQEPSSQQEQQQHHQNQQQAIPERLPIDFDPFRAEIEAFKQAEIYGRIWREGEREQPYLALFSGLDNLKSTQLLYLSSAGLKATERDNLGAEGTWMVRKTEEGKEEAGRKSMEGERVVGADEPMEDVRDVGAPAAAAAVAGSGSNENKKRSRAREEGEEEEEEEQADS